MAESYSEIESRISQALGTIAAHETPNIAALTREYDVPVSRLRNRYNGRGSRTNCGENGRMLSDDQEKALCNMIDRDEKHGIYWRQWQLQNRANRILAHEADDDDDTPHTVGKNWAGRFLKRHPQYEIRVSKPLANERKWSHDVITLGEWYEAYKEATDRCCVQPEDVWNFDETGLRVGVGGKQKVIVSKGNLRRLFHGDADDREHLTCVEFVSGGGRTTSP